MLPPHSQSPFTAASNKLVKGHCKNCQARGQRLAPNKAEGMGGSTTSSGTSAAPPPEDLPKKVKKQLPQKTVDQLWEAFTTKYPGKVHSILPNNVYAETKAAKSPKGLTHGQKTGKSYHEAAAECRHAVEKIAKECRRVNMKYRDPHFDIEVSDFRALVFFPIDAKSNNEQFDLKWQRRDTLDGLIRGESTCDLAPKSVKRVTVGSPKH